MLVRTINASRTDPGGADIARRDLTEEAFFLAKLVAELLPEEPDVVGLPQGTALGSTAN
jgi:predicted RNA polymerase sigma factor